MISIEWFTVFSRADGSSSRMGPNKAIYIINEHPALYLAKARKDLTEVYRSRRDGDRADDIVALHSAIEVPDGLLTEDQIDRMS
jgi:hypothetical protein